MIYNNYMMDVSKDAAERHNKIKIVSFGTSIISKSREVLIPVGRLKIGSGVELPLIFRNSRNSLFRRMPGFSYFFVGPAIPVRRASRTFWQAASGEFCCLLRRSIIVLNLFIPNAVSLRYSTEGS